MRLLSILYALFFAATLAAEPELGRSLVFDLSSPQPFAKLLAVRAYTMAGTRFPPFFLTEVPAPADGQTFQAMLEENGGAGRWVHLRPLSDALARNMRPLLWIQKAPGPAFGGVEFHRHFEALWRKGIPVLLNPDSGPVAGAVLHNFLPGDRVSLAVVFGTFPIPVTTVRHEFRHVDQIFEQSRAIARRLPPVPTKLVELSERWSAFARDHRDELEAGQNPPFVLDDEERALVLAFRNLVLAAAEVDASGFVLRSTMGLDDLGELRNYRLYRRYLETSSLERSPLRSTTLHNCAMGLATAVAHQGARLRRSIMVRLPLRRQR